MKILLVDDQRLFVESLRVVIETRAPDLEVVGVAYDGNDALDVYEQTHPDLVVMDVRMPRLDGVEATHRLTERYPNAKVLMLTTFDDDTYVYQAIHYGAVGYLLKDMPPAELIAAIRAATAGAVQISPSVAAKLVNRALSGEEIGTQAEQAARAAEGNRVTEALRGTEASRAPRPPAGKTPRTAVPALSRREEEVLGLVARGLDNREIAAELHIAEQTVKNRVSDLYFRFEVHDRLHLIRAARELGFE